MRRELHAGSGRRTMASACVLAALAAGVSGTRAVVVAPPPSPLVPAATDPLLDAASRPTISLEAVLRATPSDPFDPERRAPGRRLVLGEPTEAAPEMSQGGELRLIGTAVLPGGSGFALSAWGNEQPRIIRLNEAVGPYTLQDVRPGEADFVDPAGERVTLIVPKGSS